MDEDLSQYPEGSVLSQIVMEVYTHDGDITILYDRALTQELIGLEFSPETSELLFDFVKGKIPYGMKIRPEISHVFENVDSAVLLQIDREKDEAVLGLEVPVKLI